MKTLMTVAAASAVLLLSGAGSAEAAVYCKRVGFPKGCVVRPAAPAVTVVYCTSPGIPAGCVVRPATGAVVVTTPGVGRVGVGVNRGGPVNRVGVR